MLTVISQGLLATMGMGTAYYTMKGVFNFKVGEQKLKDILKHNYVVGQTGVGKTIFLINKFLEYKDKGSIIFISYKDQKTTEELLSSISDKDRDRTIYINPVEPGRKVGFGMYGNKRDDISNSMYVDNMLAIYKALWGSAIGASSEDIFRMIGLGVADMDIRTPIEIYKCLGDKKEHGEYRTNIIKNTRNDIVKDFFTWELPKKINNYNAISPPRNKQRRIVSDSAIKYTLCQNKPLLDLERATREGKIIIANFNQEVLGPEIASFLSAFFLSQVQLMGFSREDKSTPIFIFADEFQNYVTSTFGKILSEARSFNMSFTLAHQYMSQIPGYLLDAIEGNVANKYYFRVGKQDAAMLRRFVQPDFSEDDLVSMEDYHYLKEIIVNSHKQPIVKEKAPKPFKIYDNSKYIKKRSKREYGVKVSAIDKDIKNRLGIEELKSTPKARNEGEI